VHCKAGNHDGVFLAAAASGSVEQAFGGKICCLINELSEATEDDDLRVVQDRVDKVRLREGGGVN
jgi:hypothetical protein